MSKIPQIFFCFLIFNLINPTLKAQKNRFNTGVVAGLNFAELEGEGILDYFGLNAGVISSAQISPKGHLGMELLYSVNGEYILPDFYPNVKYGKIRLHHLEIPFYYSHAFETIKNEKPIKISLQAGLAYHYLFKKHLETFEEEDITDQILISKPSKIHGKIGLCYYLNPHTAINLRMTIPTDSNLDWTFALRGIYTI